MRDLQASTDIIPMGELKVHAGRVLRQAREGRRPVFITQHGKPAGVLLSPAEYDRLTEDARFLAAVRDGLADEQAGRLLDDADLDTELAIALGPRPAR